MVCSVLRGSLGSDSSHHSLTPLTSSDFLWSHIVPSVFPQPLWPDNRDAHSNCTLCSTSAELAVGFSEMAVGTTRRPPFMKVNFVTLLCFTSTNELYEKCSSQRFWGSPAFFFHCQQPLIHQAEEEWCDRYSAKMTPRPKHEREPLPIFGWTVMSLPPRLSLTWFVSVCCAYGQSNRAQLFLKKEKSLLSRSETRRARLGDWLREDPDRELWAERHSSWCLSISCWSITLCISS